VTGEIAALIELQELCQFRSRKTRERDTLPSELKEVDRAYREKVESIDSLRKISADADRARRASESRFAEVQERLKKYQTQLMGVKNSREYGAVLNEIDTVKKQAQELEDEVVELMEKIETTQKDLEAREAALPEDTGSHEEALSGWRETQREIDAEISRAAGRIGEIEKALPKKRLEEFHRLFDRKNGRAVVSAAGGSCSACHVRLRPALYQSVRMSTEVVTCDSCKRILYEPREAAAPAP